MYYQINAIMEKKKYEEKPSVVVVDRVVDQIYTTVNFGIREVEGGYEAYTATMTGHLTADEFVKRINGYGLNEEMTTQELETIFEALGFAGGNETSVFKEFMLNKIAAYDRSETVNSFMLAGNRIWLDKATRVGLVNSIGIEKDAGKLETNLWFGGVKYTIPVDTALQMLAALELYALQCYNVTAEHAAQVEQMETAEEVKSFDYSAGYPEQLVFNL